MRITVNLDTHLVITLPTPLRIKAGAQALVEMTFARNGSPVSLGDGAFLEIAFKARSGGGIVVFANNFDAAAGPSYSGLVDFNDSRLIDLIGSSAHVELLGEVFWTVGGNRFRATNFGIVAEAPLVTGPASSESGPVFLTQTESDSRYAGRAAHLSDLSSAEEAKSNLGLGNVEVPIPQNSTQEQTASALADTINAEASLQGMLAAEASGTVLTISGLVKDVFYPEAWDFQWNVQWASVSTTVEACAETREVYQLRSEGDAGNPSGWTRLGAVLTDQVPTDRLVGQISTGMLTGQISTGMLTGQISTSMLSGAIPIDKGGTGTTTTDAARQALGGGQTMRWTPTSAGSGKWYRIIAEAWWKKSGLLSITTEYNSATWHQAGSVVIAFSAASYQGNNFAAPIAGGSVLFSGRHVPPWFPSMARVVSFSGDGPCSVDVFIPSFSGTPKELVFKLSENPTPTWCRLLTTPTADPLDDPVGRDGHGVRQRFVACGRYL